MHPSPRVEHSPVEPFVDLQSIHRSNSESSLLNRCESPFQVGESISLIGHALDSREWEGVSVASVTSGSNTLSEVGWWAKASQIRRRAVIIITFWRDVIPLEFR